MELLLNDPQKNIIILHMSLLRNSVKNGFKKTYGRKEGKEKLRVFDQLLNTFKDQFVVEAEETKETYFTTYYISDEEKEMLLSFLDWYIEKLFVSGNDISYQVELLTEIKNKCQCQEPGGICYEN